MSRTNADTWGLEPGDVVVADCTVQEHLGGGQHYEAYSAFDARLLSPVVVKLLRPGRVDDQDAVRRLRREIEIVGRLNHPGIVRGLHASLDTPRPYLCLERIAGPRLFDFVAEHGPVDSAVVLPLAVEIAAALHYLHGDGFVHFDVTPANVILGSPARLIDLSLARAMDDAAYVGPGTGTRGYVAPEVQGRDRGSAPGPASDIWSLGATLAYALTSHAPREGMGWPSHVPDGLKALVLSMLSPDPADRPTAGAVFDAADSLAAALPAPRIDFFNPRGRA